MPDSIVGNTFPVGPLPPFWRRLHGQLFLTHLVVLLPLVAGIGWILQGVVERQILRVMTEQLEQAADLAYVALEPPVRTGVGLEPIMQRLSENSGLRITLIAVDGEVLADSELLGQRTLAGDHSDRPEVIAALATGAGTDIRVSATTRERYLYHAMREGIAGTTYVFRVAIPYDQVVSRINAARQGFVALLGVALLLGGVLSYIVAQRATAPIDGLRRVAIELGRGRFDVEMPPDPGGELQILSQTLRWLRGQLREKVREIEEEKALLMTMLGAMTEGVMVVDATGHVLLTNATALDLLGVADQWNPDRSEGRLLLEVTRHARLHDLVERAIATGLTSREEVENRRGPRRHLGLSVAPLREGGDEATRGAVAVIYDMTQLRQLERVRQDFVVNVSHELRTPVAAIRGWAETLTSADIEMPDFVHEQLLTILRHSLRLGALVDDLLVLARLETRGLEDVLVEVDLAYEIDEVVGSLDELSESRQIEVSVDIAPETVAIRIEPRALEYILRNLIENAIKYTSPGGRVYITTSVGEGDSLRISVRDTGVGIEEKHLSRVFERFYRVDRGRSRDVGGTGLGLSIVKHFSEALGGAVEVHSEVGVGSTFTVRIPSSTWRSVS
jgi:two-component system phosphate regulon sensor histidine kinase PhoR